MSTPEHFDVVLVGAGISAIGLAHHLREQCPDKRFVMLESKETYGGTWHTHTYPGIRSDSDLYTFGYRFKPWTGAPIANGDVILDYMGAVIDEDGLRDHIRYQHEILAADWDSGTRRWSLRIRRSDLEQELTLTCDFFIWSGGYYDHKKGYTPEWPGFEQYQGEIIHPQHWPANTDLTDKRVVVIGSGATAATLIPNIAEQCQHVTMLQRSPTYFWTGENRNELADRLRKLDLPEEWVHEIVRRDLLETAREIQQASAHFPDLAKEELLKIVREHVGEELTAKHFTPNYRPWQQRLAYVPDGDLFKAVSEGRASIVTDHIDRFVEAGIALKSGEVLEADVVITATGFNLSALGGIPVRIDEQLLDPAETFTYRGIMLSDVPNFAMVFGYLRTSWTMRVDLLGDYLCRLLNHMTANASQVVTPRLRPEDANMGKHRWISEDEFNPGYMNRGAHLMPNSGDHEPWLFSPDYYVERDQMPEFALDDGVLTYS